MNRRIRVLDSHCVNQIAAGEVVERPLSVVKELVENALDASARKIEITIQGGGTSLIKIKDDGTGIQPEDLRLAVLPHATSKIQKIEDLESLHTLGFRGEALPSIAAVSKLSILTRTADQVSGFEISIEGGRIISLEENASSVGTLVTVKDLFFNTPARLKFLRSPATEFGLISDMVSKLALARPDVSFTLKHANKVVLSTPGNGDLLEAIAAVLGKELARKFIPLNYEDEQFTINGYISLPDQVRSSRSGLTFMVNGRVIRSQALSGALKNGYHTLIPSNTYPYAVISFTMSPSVYDVNVHPAKLEIKFKDEKLLCEKLTEVIRMTLLEKKPVTSFFSDQRSDIKPDDPYLDHPYPEDKRNHSHKNHTQRYHVDQLKLIYEADQNQLNTLSATKIKESPNARNLQDYNDYHIIDTDPLIRTNTTTNEQEVSSIFLDIRPLAQVFGTYILATNDTQLYIIDQHAAHERIRYEKLLQESKQSNLTSQMLLVPEVIETTVQEEQIIIENIEALRDLGFILEHFGDRTYLLRGVPVRNDIEAPGKMFKMFLDEVLKTGSIPSQEKLLQEWIFTIACRTSIKGNERLSIPEMEELIQSLGKTENSYTCPHGRPILIEMSRNDLERKFYR